MIAPGIIVGDRYRIRRALGGGSGLKRVYLARDIALGDRPCAIAEITDTFGSAPQLEAAARLTFEHEARRLTRLAHDHLVFVYDFFSGGNRHFLVMEHLEGETLEQKLAAAPFKRLDEESATDIALQILSALEYLHSQMPPIICRGIKPSNVIVNAEGRVKLIDFGLQHLLTHDQTGTVSADMRGYAPPEQYDGKVEPRSDLYALAATTHYLLSGRDPATEIPFSFPPLQQLRRNCNPVLAAIINEALAYDLAQRIQSAADFKLRLQRLANPAAPAPRFAPPPATPVNQVEPGALTVTGIVATQPCPRCTRDIPADAVVCPYCSAQFDKMRVNLGLGNSDKLPERDVDLKWISGTLRKGMIGSLETYEAYREDWNTGAATKPEMIENAQFTVYRPRAVMPGVWVSLLAFAHRTERSPDAPADAPDPLEEVERQAEQVLGQQSRDYTLVRADSAQALPRLGEISFVPEIEGFEFNPPRRTFLWIEDVHREDFRFRASAMMLGRTARGRVTVFLGSIIIAEVALSIRVEANLRSSRSAELTGAVQALPYRKVFASYSHADSHVVEHVQQFIKTFGDEYLRDVKDLRAGEVWNTRLQELIEQANVFQLFWSSNSMRSPFVRQEWEYALGLERPHFIRPTYWEDPLPESPTENLPPDSLRRLHFQRIPQISVPTASSESGASPRLRVSSNPVPKPRLTERISASSPSARSEVAPKASQRRLAEVPIGAKRRRWNSEAAIVGAVAVVVMIASSVMFTFRLSQPVRPAEIAPKKFAPEDELPRDIAALRAMAAGSPQEEALRSEIIVKALRMNPPPEVPPEALDVLEQGKRLLATAKTASDARAAAAVLEKALLIAPWLAQSYVSLAQAQELAGDYSGAIASLKCYELADPNADLTQVRQRIGRLERRKAAAAH